MSKHLIVFDTECTGLDPAKDRIVSLTATKLEGWDVVARFSDHFNPGRPMSPEVIAVHGITNEQAATFRPFSEVSLRILKFFEGCDLGGFNLTNFDIPILWEEFYRCGIEWDLSGVSIIDAGNIFKKKEERTLSAAVQFYCNRKHESAHSAEGDVGATIDVLAAQLTRYPELSRMTPEQLAEFCRFDNRIDLAGKIVRDKDGDPAYNIGKSKGVKVKNDPSFAYWMLDKDFTQQTKRVLRDILDAGRGEEDQESGQQFYDQDEPVARNCVA